MRRDKRTSRYHGIVCRICGQRFLGTSNEVRVSNGVVTIQLGEVGIILTTPKQGGIVVTQYTRHRYRPVYDQPTWMMSVGTIRVSETKC